MVDRKQIVELFEGRKSEKFRKHSIYFYQEPRTISEVKELSGVSRKTITDHINIFKKEEGVKKDFLKPKLGKGKPYLFTHKLVAVYLSEKANLSKKEEEALLEFLEKTDDYVRNLDSWSAVSDIVLISMIYADILEEVGDSGVAVKLPDGLKGLLNQSEQGRIKELVDAVREIIREKKGINLVNKMATSDAKIESEAKNWRERLVWLPTVQRVTYLRCLEQIRNDNVLRRFRNRIDKKIDKFLGADPEALFGGD